jgi:endonuclease/exonuclease/phosphatase (EEP) superfamily protein YafD
MGFMAIIHNADLRLLNLWRSLTLRIRALLPASRYGLIAWGALVNSYLVSHVLWHDSPPLIGQLNYLAHWLTFPSLVIFALALVRFVGVGRRAAYLALWLLPSVLAFTLWHLPYYIPKSAPQTQGTTLTIANYNAWIHADNQQIVEVIRQMDADLVGLQENRPPLHNLIQDQLGQDYPHQILESVPQEYEGLGLLSRYPILEWHVEVSEGDLPDVDLDRMRYLRAVVDVNGQPLVVYVTHPPIVGFWIGLRYDDEAHNDEIRQVLALIAQETLPLVLLCDCNFPPLSRPYEWTDALLDDAHRVQGWGLGTTYQGSLPVRLPVFRIDYIWYRGGLTPLAIEVWDDRGASDHAPLWSRFALPAPG